MDQKSELIHYGAVNRNLARIYFGALCIWLEAGSSTTAARCGASFTAGE
jgi:hypothetical protein